MTISFSAQIGTLKVHSVGLEKVEGSFILRDIPKKFPPKLSKKIQKLRASGAIAPVLIDPESFKP
jgi:hypothetical protein